SVPMHVTFISKSYSVSVLCRCQDATMPGLGLPGAEHFERMADNRRLVAQHGLAEFFLQADRDRLGNPGTAADIDRIAIGMVTKRLAPEIISKLHVVASRDLMEVMRVQRFGGTANDGDAATRKEGGERLIHGVGPFV